MSKLHRRKVRHDVYHQRAKASGFVARSYFKLEEIDEKHHVVKKGMRVLDLGCRPGSWLQYARQKVGERAELVGVDRQALDIVIPGSRILIGDVLELSVADILGELRAFDLVLSDMAPDTTGVRSADQARSEALFERALDIATQTLSPKGNFVGKLFQGPCFQDLVNACRRAFDKVAIMKPKSSRAPSIEQYVVAVGRRPPE